jgi:hypothetical protein
MTILSHASLGSMIWSFSANRGKTPVFPIVYSLLRYHKQHVRARKTLTQFS